MGVEEFLLTSTINGIAAQRLVRKLCRDCRQPYQPLPEMLERCGIASGHMAQFHHAKGCPQCNGTGYKGRTSIMEIMPMSDAIRQHVLHHADAAVIRSAALAEGMQSLFAAGIDKAMRGETSLDEVFRVAEAA
jgi:general secretion pathway protein E